MKLVRTTQYQFGWLIIFPLLDVVFLMIFFLLLSSNFVLQPGISVNVPFSKFMLAPQMKYQIRQYHRRRDSLFSRSKNFYR